MGWSSPKGWNGDGWSVAPAVAAGSVWGVTGTQLTRSTGVVANDTVTNTGGASWSTAKGAQGHSAGKWYLELVFTAGSTSNLLVGFADATTGAGAGLDNFLGSFNNSVGNLESGGQGFPQGGGFIANSFAGGWGPLISGDVIMLDLDCTGNGTDGFGYLGKNGTWLNGGDPTSGASGTGAAFAFPGTPTLFPAVSFELTTDGSMRIRTASGFAFSPPSGSLPWG